MDNRQRLKKLDLKKHLVDQNLPDLETATLASLNIYSNYHPFCGFLGGIHYLSGFIHGLQGEHLRIHGRDNATYNPNDNSIESCASRFYIYIEEPLRRKTKTILNQIGYYTKRISSKEFVIEYFDSMRDKLLEVCSPIKISKRK